jgi:protein TonB
MSLFERRWPIAFLLALGVHAALFRYGGLLYDRANKSGPPRLAPGFETLELTLVDEPEPPPPAPAPAPPPPVEAPPVVVPPEVKPPEPVKEPEPAPVPEPKPVLTEPVPAAPAPVVAKPVPQPPPVAEAPRPAPVTVLPPVPVSTAAVPSTASSVASSGTGQPAGGFPPSDQPGGPAPLSTIHPRYPMGSRVRGEEGVVSLRARVDERGRPVEVAVTRSSGYEALDAAAEKAVKGAQFVPPRRGAPPESYVANLSIRFQLKD